VDDASELLILFGANVRHQRRAKGWPQDRLAAAANVSSQTVGMIERGLAAASFETAARIARALDIPSAALFAVGAGDMPKGDRGKLLHRINATLSRMNEGQLAKAAKMLEVFAGS